jgi:hypothetical protein
VANYANLRYSDMKPDIQALQSEIEGAFLARQPLVEQTALELADADPEVMKRFLTAYCVNNAERTVERWRELGEFLIRKYNDGYVQTSPGRAREKGYGEEWLRRVVAERPRQFELGDKDPDVPESELIDS